MRSNISLLISILSLPAIVLYGFYIVLETYALFVSSAFLSNGKIPIIRYPIASIFKIFIHFCGITTWILIIPMAKAWCKNIIVSRKMLIMFTAAMCIGLSPFYSMMYSFWNAGVIIALPAIIFGIYLIIWHMNDQTNEKIHFPSETSI